MPGLYKWIFIGAASVVIAASGVALARLGAMRMMERPTADYTYAVDSLNKGGLATFSTQIVKARTVVIAAREITSGSLLEAIATAHKNGSDVRVLLDGKINADVSRGALGFLKKQGVVTRVTNSEMNDQFILLDGKALFLTSAPWTPDAAKQAGLVHLLVSQGAGSKVSRFFESAWEGGRKI